MQLCELKIKQIRISGDNPRIINKKSGEFGELVESIKALGVKVPIHVRQNGKGHELLAGERRLLAAGEAGLTTIPALDHGKLTDEAAFEVTFAENFAREDLSPLEQGKAVATLLVKYKGDVEAVTSKMAKSTRWVLQRRAIHEKLIKPWRLAVIQNINLKDWTASHLQLIASMPSEIQVEMLNYFQYHTELPAVHELKKAIADRMRLLSAANWDLDDSKILDGAKACNKCSKRSSSQPGLFDDTTEAEEVAKNDRCLDITCWTAKLKAHLELRIAELKAKHHELIYAVMPSDSPDFYEKEDLAERFGPVAYEWKASKEGAKDALPALIVFGANAGELRWVKFPKIVNRTGEKKIVGVDSKKKPTPLKQRRVLLDRKRWFEVIRDLRKKIEKQQVENIVSKDRILTVMALTATFGTSFAWGEAGKWSGFSKMKKRSEALQKLWIAVRKTICNNLTYNDPITQTPNDYIKAAKCAAKLLGIDIDAMFKEVSEKVYTEPKTWAGLKEDGTPKTAKVKKAKAEKKVRKCHICGCTEEKPCITAEGPCHWAGFVKGQGDLCSACVGKAPKAKKPKKATKVKKSKSKGK